MVSGLPARPLSYPEVAELNRSDAVGFVLPATPQSIETADDNSSRIYDLLITSGEITSAVVYEDENTRGWTAIATAAADADKEELVADVIAHRDYDIDDEEKALAFVSELYGTMDELSEELVAE
jgi:hypothetical protein